MKLRKGMRVTIGRKTWEGEIPDQVFASISEKWKPTQVSQFKERFAEEAKTSSAPAEGSTSTKNKK